MKSKISIREKYPTLAAVFAPPQGEPPVRSSEIVVLRDCRHPKNAIAQYRGYDWCSECGAIRKNLKGFAPFMWKRPHRAQHNDQAERPAR